MKITLWISFISLNLISFACLAQNLSEYELFSSTWAVTNYSLDSTNLLDQNTITLRQTSYSSRRTNFEDTTLTGQYWQIDFGEYYDLDILHIDYSAAASGISKNLTTEMYPCVNKVWSKFRKEITFHVNNNSTVATYKISQFDEGELILRKLQ